MKETIILRQHSDYTFIVSPRNMPLEPVTTNGTTSHCPKSKVYLTSQVLTVEKLSELSKSKVKKRKNLSFSQISRDVCKISSLLKGHKISTSISIKVFIHLQNYQKFFSDIVLGARKKFI
jgi:hypothetical protein